MGHRTHPRASRSASPVAAAPGTPESVFKTIVDATCEVSGRAALSHYPSRRLWAVQLHERLAQNFEVLKDLQIELAPSSERIREESAEGQPSTTGKLFASILPILL